MHYGHSNNSPVPCHSVDARTWRGPILAAVPDADRQLDREAVERVLRRASELSASTVADPHRGMTEELVLEAATEAGIEAESVRLSLAIERIGDAPPPARFDGLAGATYVTVDRVVSLDPDTLLGRVDDLLVRRHGLRRARERADRGEWRRRSDAVGSIQRAAQKFGAEGPTLGGVERVEVRTSVIDPQRTLVRVVASRQPQRKVALAGGASIGAAGVALGATAAVVAAPVAAVVAVPFAAGGVVVARRGRRAAQELGDDLERMLDAIERGSRQVSLSAELKRMLANWRR